MNEAALATAQRALRIADVYVRDLVVRPAENFDARGLPLSQANFQCGPKGTQTVELDVDQPGEAGAQQATVHLWRVLFFTTCRVLWPRDEPIPADFSPTREDVAVEIQATFIAEYQLHEKVDEAALLEFARYNVSYHVWPYWRELLHDVSARLRIAPVTLPMHSVRPANNGEAPAGAGEAKASPSNPP